MNQFGKWLCAQLLKLIKAPAEFITALAIVLGACLIIINPGGKPYISVPGNNLTFDLPSFQNCEIAFLDTTKVQSYAVAIASESTSSATAYTSKKVDRDTAVLPVENPYSKNKPRASSDPLYHVKIYLGSSLSADIKSVSIDSRAIDLRSFFKHYLVSRGEYVRFRYIRKDLAGFLFFANDAISNYILTCMFIGIVLLATQLGRMELIANFYSDQRFVRYLAASTKIKGLTKKKQRLDALDKFTDHWATWNARFRFWQALGPAVGFILTVSSLVAALHDAFRSANDLDAFLKGIHVALVSTFLGLLLRILALEAERVNDKLLSRADIRLRENEVDPATTLSSSGISAP